MSFNDPNNAGNPNNIVDSYIDNDYMLVDQAGNAIYNQSTHIGKQNLAYDPYNEAYQDVIRGIGSLFEQDEDSKQLRRLAKVYNVEGPIYLKYNSKCYRYPKADPYNFIDSAREYVFITKVDLPMLSNNGTLLAPETTLFPYLHDLWNSGYKPSVFANLCYTSLDFSTVPEVPIYERNYPFMRILSNRKTSNLNLQDINTEELESPTNLFGSKVVYPKTSALSDENMEFSLEFEDTKYLEIYHLFKTYDLYRQGKWLGIFGPGIHAENVYKENEYFKGDWGGNGNYRKYLSYITNKILYDHMAIYRFLVASDGVTILHGVKFTGCYPKSISRSSLSELDEKGGLKITVTFKVSGWMEEDMVEIARDFDTIMYNYVPTSGLFLSNDPSAYQAQPIYDTEIDRVSNETVDYPFIRKENGHSGIDLLSREQSITFLPYYLLWGNHPLIGNPDGYDNVNATKNGVVSEILPLANKARLWNQ